MEWFAPTLGLAGVVGAASIAFVATRRTAQDARRKEFHDHRAIALQELVQRLNELEFDMRLGDNPPPVAELKAQIGPLNIFLKRRQALLRTDESDAARRKLDGLILLAEKYAGTTATERASIATTAANPVVDENLASAFRTFMQVDELLAGRLRAAQGGPRRL